MKHYFKEMSTEKKVLLVLKSLSFLCGIGFVFGALMLVGGIGGIEYASEVGTILSPMQELRQILLSIAGIPVCWLFYQGIRKIDDIRIARGDVALMKWYSDFDDEEDEFDEEDDNYETYETYETYESYK